MYDLGFFHPQHDALEVCWVGYLCPQLTGVCGVFIHSPTQGHGCCFQFLVITNNVARHSLGKEMGWWARGQQGVQKDRVGVGICLHER